MSQTSAFKNTKKKQQQKKEKRKATQKPGVLLQPFPLLQRPAQGINIISPNNFMHFRQHQTTIIYVKHFPPNNFHLRRHLTTITATSIWPTTTRPSTPGAKKRARHKSEIKKVSQKRKWLLSVHRTNFERICQSRAISGTLAPLSPSAPLAPRAISGTLAPLHCLPHKLRQTEELQLLCDGVARLTTSLHRAFVTRLRLHAIQCTVAL